MDKREAQQQTLNVKIQNKIFNCFFLNLDNTNTYKKTNITIKLISFSSNTCFLNILIRSMTQEFSSYFRSY